MVIQQQHRNGCPTNSLDGIMPKKRNWLSNWTSQEWKKNKDPDIWIMNLEHPQQRIAECGKTINDNELIMHILYHLPSEYDNINDQYMKDLDDEK